MLNFFFSFLILVCVMALAVVVIFVGVGVDDFTVISFESVTTAPPAAPE